MIRSTVDRPDLAGEYNEYAWKLFLDARDARTNLDVTYPFTLYLLQYNTDRQKLIVVDRVDKEQPIEFTIEKRDFNNKAINDLKFNVAVSSGGSLQSSPLISSGDVIKIKPDSGTKTIKLALTETGNNSWYGSTYTLTVTLNDNGTLKDIAIQCVPDIEDAASYDENTKTVILKNKPKYDLTLKKIDALTGAGLGGVTFKVSYDNVASINSETDLPTYVPTGSGTGLYEFIDIIPEEGKNPVTLAFEECGTRESIAGNRL